MPPGFYLVPRLQDVTTFRDCIKFQSLLRSAGHCELTTGLHGGFFLPGADFGRCEAGNPDFKIFAGLLIAAGYAPAHARRGSADRGGRDWRPDFDADRLRTRSDRAC